MHEDEKDCFQDEEGENWGEEVSTLSDWAGENHQPTAFTLQGSFGNCCA
jgi:hypothetical protein